ncbi:MAG: rhodanese-like domain-containing protein [Candidatus Uhrbacteria bacterium]
MFRFLVSIFLFSVLIIPRPAAAVPPPDFIFAIGSQVAQVFAFSALILSMVAGAVAQMFRAVFFRLQHKKILVVIVAVVIVAASLITALAYEGYRNQTAKSLELFRATYQTIPPVEDKEKKVEVGDFFQTNQTLPIAISNEEFNGLLAEQDLYILDAREDEEYNIGNFSGSTHVRFADLLAGEWANLPTDRVIYVFCWSGIRGEEVTKFLREKNLIARFLEDGADGWVKFGGRWNGEIAFSAAYSEERYKKTLTLDELLTAIDNKAAIVDSRPATSFATRHIPESINISIIYTPTVKIVEALSLVPKGTAVITICDNFVSCFDAKITGLKLEAQGHEFLGRYVQLQEYQNSFPE